MLLVIRGCVEGVVEDVTSDLGLFSDHPLGRCVPVVSRVHVSTACAQRTPNLCIIGPDSALPSSSFLNCSALTMKYTAKTEVEAIIIRKISLKKNKTSKWAVLQSVFTAVQSIKTIHRTSSRSPTRTSNLVSGYV